MISFVLSWSVIFLILWGYDFIVPTPPWRREGWNTSSWNSEKLESNPWKGWCGARSLVDRKHGRDDALSGVCIIWTVNYGVDINTYIWHEEGFSYREPKEELWLFIPLYLMAALENWWMWVWIQQHLWMMRGPVSRLLWILGYICSCEIEHTLPYVAEYHSVQSGSKIGRVYCGLFSYSWLGTFHS